MSLLFWGLTISVLGKVLLAAGVLIAHGKLAHERQVDQAVIHSFHVEQLMTGLGLLLIIIGYGMEIYFYGFTDMLTCAAGECGMAASVILSQ